MFDWSKFFNKQPYVSEVAEVYSDFIYDPPRGKYFEFETPEEAFVDDVYVRDTRLPTGRKTVVNNYLHIYPSNHVAWGLRYFMETPSEHNHWTGWRYRDTVPVFSSTQMPLYIYNARLDTKYPEFAKENSGYGHVGKMAGKNISEGEKMDKKRSAETLFDQDKVVNEAGCLKKKRTQTIVDEDVQVRGAIKLAAKTVSDDEVVEVPGPPKLLIDLSNEDEDEEADEIIEVISPPHEFTFR